MTKASAHPNPTDLLVQAAAQLRDELADLRFSDPVACVYNPLEYAWEVHAAYLRKYGAGPKKVVFLGMNPGPWGMVQTGVPFGEVKAAKEWLKLTGAIHSPACEHPKRPIRGFDCHRTEVSGQRVWDLFRDRFGSPSAFFLDHFVANYCPLAFVEESGRNRTPDKLPAREVRQLYESCDRHLQSVVEALEPEWLIGIGRFAEERAHAVLAGAPVRIGCILHPSPASPAANRDWAGEVTRQLQELGVW
jgi:single-strand selective monofunctional uracil DNA glycosylase